MADSKEIAQWMNDLIVAEKVLYQYEAVDLIEKRFGPEWVYENDNGNPAISPRVLAQFRKLRDASIEWDSGEKRWDYFQRSGV